MTIFNAHLSLVYWFDKTIINEHGDNWVTLSRKKDDSLFTIKAKQMKIYLALNGVLIG